jgi:hypothetical protein
MLHISYASKDSLKLLVHIVFNSAPYIFSFLTEIHRRGLIPLPAKGLKPLNIY